MSKMPKQRPGLSKQDYCTPKEFLKAIKNRLHIEEFKVDLAADDSNTVAPTWFTEECNSLVQDWVAATKGGWGFLNPPFADIEPWVKKAAEESWNGAHVVMLVPASVGSNWWREWVEPQAYQSYLNGRLCFIPNWKELGYKSAPLYPKDCALLLYTPWGFLGHEIWRWSNSVEAK